MPSVASENSIVQHTRHQSTNRSRSDSADREPSSPFAELLDSAAPTNEPRPTARNARAERSDTARPAENRRKTGNVDKRDDAEPAKAARDTRDTASTDEAKASDETTKTAKSGEGAAAAADAGDSTAATGTEEKAKAAQDAEFAAALAALVDTAQPAASTGVAVAVTPPATDAAATDLAASAEAAASAETPAIDPLAALKAAEQAAAPGGAPQAAEDQAAAALKTEAKGEVKAVKADAKDDAKSPSQAEPEIRGEAQVAASQEDAGGDGAPGQNGDKPGHEVRYAAKPDAEKSDVKPQANHGTEVSAVAKQQAADAPGAMAAASAANADAGAAAASAAPVVATAHTQPAALTSTQLQARIQAQLQASADASPAVPLSGVAVEIASQALAGKNRFEIRLDPPELGRIDVKLDIDGDGNATTRLVVERSDTLDLLKRDSSQLERALQQAGLKTSDNALEFSLRQEAFQQNDDQGASRGAQLVLPDEDAPLHAQRQNYGRLLGMGGGLDIRV
ncbi:MAG: flagellar hook-length control protein FliK [Xanthobacteraceae bacterium]|nr:flagellar hook-length control protein FliK [Xanthobacteraceae bacterium]